MRPQIRLPLLALTLLLVLTPSAWARVYDAQTGAWLQRDRMQYHDGMNLYACVANRPIVARDPMGLLSVAAPGVGSGCPAGGAGRSEWCSLPTWSEPPWVCADAGLSGNACFACCDSKALDNSNDPNWVAACYAACDQSPPPPAPGDCATTHVDDSLETCYLCCQGQRQFYGLDEDWERQCLDACDRRLGGSRPRPAPRPSPQQPVRWPGEPGGAPVTQPCGQGGTCPVGTTQMDLGVQCDRVPGGLTCMCAQCPGGGVPVRRAVRFGSCTRYEAACAGSP